MQLFLNIIHVIASLFLVCVVLLQSGRGGGMGAAFGGASGQIFGGRGASSFLSRLTSGAAIVFFCTSLTLSMLSSRHRSVVRSAAAQTPRPAAAAGQGTDAPPADAAPAAEGQNAAPTDTDSQDTSLRGDTAPQGAEAPVKRPDAPEPTPPGVPTGD